MSSNENPFASSAHPGRFGGKRMLSLKRVGVMSVGIFTATMAAVMSFIAAIFLVILTSLGLRFNGAFNPGAAVAGAGLLIIMPLIYGIFGFIGGVINAVIYNVIAEITGGIRLEFDDPDFRS